jgi:uncharacterized protein (DUF1778 family)
MPFEDTGRTPLTAVINIRLTPDKASELRKAAGLAGLTVKQFVLRQAQRRPANDSADDAIANELRRLGDLLKQRLISH